MDPKVAAKLIDLEATLTRAIGSASLAAGMLDDAEVREYALGGNSGAALLDLETAMDRLVMARTRMGAAFATARKVGKAMAGGKD